VIEIALLLALGASFARFLVWLKPWVNEYDEIDCKLGEHWGSKV